MAGKKGVKRGPQVSDEAFVNAFLKHRVKGTESAENPLGFLAPGAYELIAKELNLEVQSVQMRASRMRNGNGDASKAVPLPELERTAGGRSRDAASLIALIGKATGADVSKLQAQAKEKAQASAARAAKREAAKQSEGK